MHRAGAVRTRRSDSERAPASRPRVLIIDDDSVCEILREVLSDEGHAVATAPHGAAASELVERHNPAVIMLALRTPIMDGWSFAEQYRRIATPPLSLILLSAYLTSDTCVSTQEDPGKATGSLTLSCFLNFRHTVSPMETTWPKSLPPRPSTRTAGYTRSTNGPR